MSWRHYIGGIATTLALGSMIYFGVNCRQNRGEKVIGELPLDSGKLRVIQTDLRYAIDEYRIEILDKEGNVKVKTDSTTRKPLLTTISKEGIEQKLSFED